MTDEEKYITWRNANSRIDRHNVTDTSIGHKHIHWNTGVDRHKAYLDGLADGRKEECFEQNNDGTIRPCEVMKENEELKAQIEEQKAHCKDVDEVNEKMKCCGNCINFKEQEIRYIGKPGAIHRFSCNGLNVAPNMKCSKWELEE